MSKKINVLIADNNLQFVNSVIECFKSYDSIRITGMVSDGLSAVYYTLEQKPDIVIINSVLPKLDGLGVIEEITKYQQFKKPKYILVTSGVSSFIMKLYKQLDVDYLMLKPMDMRSLLNIVHIL